MKYDLCWGKFVTCRGKQGYKEGNKTIMLWENQNYRLLLAASER